MTVLRIALANLPYPDSPLDAVALVERAIAEAAAAGAALVAFPEAYMPGYRWPGRAVPPPDRAYLEEAHGRAARAAGSAGITAVVGTERFVGDALRLTVLVALPDGSVAGFQDKVQLDPTEDALYRPGRGRAVFDVGELRFGVVVCHEGFRYPETVRAATRRGARLVLHPHYCEAEPGSYRPSAYGEPANSFHEQAIRCRAAENECWVATVNCAGEGAPTTSAVAAPDGSVLCHQPHGKAGLLIADLDLDLATNRYADRLRTDVV